MPERARVVLDEVLSSFLGPDERYRVNGLPLAVRQVAGFLGCGATKVHEGVEWLLARKVLVRRPDRNRRNAFLYQVVHPEGWVWPEGVVAPPRGIGDLETDHVAGWGAPLLRFAPGTPGARIESSPPQVFHKAEPDVRPEANTHARSIPETRKKEDPTHSKNMDPAYYYVYFKGKRLTLTDAAVNVLNAQHAGWDQFPFDRIEDVPAKFVIDVESYVNRCCETQRPWPTVWIRRAIVRASELAETRRQEEAEWARRAAEAELLERQGQANFLLFRMKDVLPYAEADGVDVAEVERAMALLAEGNLGELEIAEILATDLEEAWAAKLAAAEAAAPMEQPEPEDTVADQIDPVKPAPDPDEVVRLEDILRGLIPLRDEPRPPDYTPVWKWSREAWLPWRSRVDLGERAAVILSDVAGGVDHEWIAQARSVVEEACRVVPVEVEEVPSETCPTELRDEQAADLVECSDESRDSEAGSSTGASAMPLNHRVATTGVRQSQRMCAWASPRLRRCIHTRVVATPRWVPTCARAPPDGLFRL
jgi:hypothetical protein